MRKLLNNPFVSIPLGLVALAFVVHALIDGNDRPRSAPFAEAEPAFANGDESDESLVAATAPTEFNPQAIVALAALTPSRNLFARVAEKAAPEADIDSSELATATIRVKGIWIQSNFRYVIIDDQILQSGQSIERVRVERIEEQGVWVATNEESHFVRPGQSWTYNYARPKGEPREN